MANIKKTVIFCAMALALSAFAGGADNISPKYSEAQNLVCQYPANF